MKTLKLLSIVASIMLCVACTQNQNNDDSTNSQTASDTVNSRGVGAAPDNSQGVSDSLRQEADTTTLKKPE
jgi:hypothetical protein